MLAANDKGTAMALSDYERRVLDEIETELGELHSSRLRRLRAAAIALWVTVLWVLLAIAGVVVSALLAPAGFAVPVAAGCGAVAGMAVGRRGRRRR
jgi:hypothetical protein